ncbi:Phenylalanyl-tRNA synthetase, B3/B4 [Phytophthora cactorum]|nr:Phenylalanyl-tRNA synthetase, B3/B4 [Phytophthora cactorum]
MPTVGVKRDELFAAMGQTYTDEEFDVLCFEFGIELDDQRETKGQAKDHSDHSDAVLYKIDVPANRYDLLCVEGIARALRIFLEKERPPVYTLTPRGEGPHSITVKPNTKLVRPYVVSAVLRDVKFTQERYDSFIDLQDKLHQNICRRRTLVAIGTHDLDTIEGPFTYNALAPNEIKFKPLSQDKEFEAKELLDFYRTNPEVKHIKPYTDIIYDSPVYPVITDKNGVVLSLPPIINGDHSKISLDTKNVFIECTATDITKAKVVLNTMIAMFSEYCAKPFTVEPVQINYEDQSVNENELTPNLSKRSVEVQIKNIYSMLFGKGEPVNLDVDRICKLCDKMQLDAKPSGNGKTIIAEVPITRSDILHPVDVIEDVGIAYGFNNIPLTIPQTQTIGMAQPLNKLGDLLRDEISRAGYIELLTHGLCSHKENFEYLNREDDGHSAVVLSNPATVEFEVVRTSMLPGVLKTIQNNKAMSIKEGLKLFEISDVVVIDDNTDVGAKNVRRICAAYTGPTDGFEVIHGLVDRIMQLMGIPSELEMPAGTKEYYTITPAEERTYFPAVAPSASRYVRCAEPAGAQELRPAQPHFRSGDGLGAAGLKLKSINTRETKQERTRGAKGGDIARENLRSIHRGSLAMDGDTLDRELASLADTITVSNPITFGQKPAWRTTQKDAELVAKRESEFAKTLPKKFVLTEPRDVKEDFALVAAAARNPMQPLRPNLLLNEDGSRSSSSANTPGDIPSRAEITTPPSRVPIAKRSHMDGILRGVPGSTEPISTIQQRAFVYDNEMNNMNRDKDTSHHRKRDAYSEYVEARARFSKMHSVN